MTNVEPQSPSTLGSSPGGDLSSSGSGGGDITATTSPQVPPEGVTHETADQVPHYRRARWMRAHSGD